MNSSADLSDLIDDNLTDAAAVEAAEAAAFAKAYDTYVYKAERRFASRDWLTEDMLIDLHYEVFGNIWSWAGKYRLKKHFAVVGVEAKEISKEVVRLCSDFKKWNSAESSVPLIEIAARLLGRLLRIHPFIEGNDRIARLFTDIFLRSRHNPIPKWPAFQKMKPKDKIHKRYIAALQAADQEDYKDLAAFIKNLMR